MPVLVKNQNWIRGEYLAETGEVITPSTSRFSCELPASSFPDGYLNVKVDITDDSEWYSHMYVEIRTNDGEVLIYESELPQDFLKLDTQDTSDWEMVYITIDTNIAFIEDPNGLAKKYVQLTMSPNYFPESALGIYITSQQLIQFKNMYPDCVSDAYRTAVGELTANIGNRFDMSAILNQADEEKKDDTIRWILLVLTAYNIASPSLNYTEPLANAYQKVSETIIKLKGGMVSLEEPAPYRTDACNANSEVITSRYNYLG